MTLRELFAKSNIDVDAEIEDGDVVLTRPAIETTTGANRTFDPAPVLLVAAHFQIKRPVKT